MKQKFKIIGTVLISFFLFIACNNSSLEKDAKKIAEIQCKAQKMAIKAASGDMSVLEESSKLAMESDSIVKAIEKKYVSESDKKKLAEEVLKAMADCK